MTFELLRPPVETFVDVPPLPLELLPLDVDVDVVGDDPEIVTFKNGFKNCQKNASEPFDCGNKKVKFYSFCGYFTFLFDYNNFNRYRVVAL